jgi:ATP-binding cassette subfamily C protein
MRQDWAKGAAEIRQARDGKRGVIAAAVLFSIFFNLLVLTGPLYMLQVYDRVLGSRSEATLFALTLLVVFLFAIMGLLDHARSRLLARVGATIQQSLEQRVFAASLRRMMALPEDPLARSAQRDLESIQRFWASPVIVALIDAPWTPIFLLALFVFHPLTGITAIIGGVIILAVALANHQSTRAPLEEAGDAGFTADRMAEDMKTEAETIRSLGMTGGAFARWHAARDRGLDRTLMAGDRGGAFSAFSRTFRLFLQSAILGVGAWLVLRGEMSGGAMIAASILLGRALQPVEQLVAQWAVLDRARIGRRRLAELLTRTPPDPTRTTLPRPRARIEVDSLTVIPPGDSVPVLKSVSFTVEPGQACGVIGPSGAGKSTLARALTGVWRPTAGRIRLDGATLDQYDEDALGSYIGYLPQRVTLFDGTIADNIARLGIPDDAKVVAAAQAAAAHEMILRLPKGYDTLVSSVGGRLSGGQIQRIGLARALYGDPVLLILDEPNSNLDNDGSVALNLAIARIKANGGAALIMAHRPAAIQECDTLLALEGGARRAFGPREQVLKGVVANHGDIARSAAAGGLR